MPSRLPPTGGFEVTKDCVVEGVSLAREDVLVADAAMAIKKLNVLISDRTLLPLPDPYGRKTDDYGFGTAPRKHPTPTSYGMGEVHAVLNP